MRERAQNAWPLGCQARPWLQALGPEVFSVRLATVMTEIASIGYTGFETALARLPLDDPDRFVRDREAAQGLTLIGAHVGVPWWNPTAADAISEIVAQAAQLPALGCTRLVVSCGAAIPTPATEEHLETCTRNLSTLGQACRSVGVRIVYHNHAWEIADDAHVIAAIVARCAPDDIMLGSDLGWVAHAGMPVAVFLERFAARIAYLHVRDVTADGGFTEIGRGILDHHALLQLLDAIGYRGWLTAESEFNALWRGQSDPVATATAQLAGLRAVRDA